MHIILKWDSPRVLLISLKMNLLASFVHFVLFLSEENLFFRNVLRWFTQPHTFFLTLLGLSHFNIMCIIIRIYFDLQIKRRSNPLLVLDFFAFRANIICRGINILILLVLSVVTFSFFLLMCYWNESPIYLIDSNFRAVCFLWSIAVPF